jgi:hypothetical protein
LKPDNSLETPNLTVREKILAATKRRYRKSKIVVDGEVIEVGLRSLNEAERTAFELARTLANNATDVKSAESSYRRRLLVLMCVELDEKGECTDKPLFQTTDIIDLESVDCSITCALYNDALDHAYISKADIEELAKNSVATAAASSPVKSA